MKLIDGRGQLGEMLKKHKLKNDWTVYHTWDFIHKEAPVQKKCFLDFVNYVNEHQNEKICFVSTLSQGDTPYTRYKRLAEEYLKHVVTDYKIIRLCNIVGKGICERFREERVQAIGTIHLTTLDLVVGEIDSFLTDNRKEYEVRGIPIPAGIVNKLILYGKNGKP